jgi:hypothetical protein
MKPEQIKQWLKESGHDRHWLADKCGVHKSTVDGWLSNRPIPRQADTAIKAMMMEGTSLNPKFTLDQFSRIQQRAKSEGMTVEQWIAKAVLGALLVTACFCDAGKACLAFIASLF